MIPRLLRIAFLALMLVSLPLTIAASPSLDFVIIQPGQPGSSEEAKPVMDALAGYLQERFNRNVEINGNYFNQTDQALAALKTANPRWGIVSLGFFVEYAHQFRMRPIGATQPAGKSHDRWYLMVAKGSAETWRQVKGSVQGTMLFQAESASRLMFAADRQQLPFDLQGTSSPLRALREVAGGKAAGVILDQTQYQALQSLPLFNELAVIHRSQSLPTAPVVSFNEPDASVIKLGGTLSKMAGDPTAKDLLMMLQTTGFGPPDPSLAGLVIEGPKRNR